VVGDFDPTAVKTDVGKALTGWKSSKPYERIPLPFSPTKPADETIDTPDKEMAFVAAGQTLEVRDDDPAYPALYLFNYMLGGSTSSRLFLRLRQKEGISYGAFSQLIAHPIDKSAFFFAGAIAAPANMDQAMSGVLDEIESMAKKGVSEKELADAKKSYAKMWESHIAEDEFVLGELNQGLFLGRTLAYWSDLNAKIDKLTVANVNAAVKLYITPEKLVKVRAGDLAKKK
jgi:zinc protease